MHPSPPITAKLTHEAIGHHAEADILLSCFPHAVFLKIPSLHPDLNIIDFAHTAFNQPCPLPIYNDDEGTKAQDVHIIKNGQVHQAMTNKKTAAELGSPLTGNARAASLLHKPLVRMRNTALLPSGKYRNTPSSILSSLENGYYLIDGNHGESELDGDFIYKISEGYHIRDGEICERLPDNAIVFGNCVNFVRSISMIGNDFEWCIDECTKEKQTIKIACGAPTIKAKLIVTTL